MTKLFIKLHGAMRPLVLLAVSVGLASSVIVGVQSTKVDASHCYQNYFGVLYNGDGFYDGRCADVNNFPNTGPPFVSTANGDGDSVGYVIPRTSKDTSLGSEALANVNDKMGFYNRLKYHYDVRGWGQGNWWAKDGAAFVVFTLLGKNPPADRNLTNADWDELLLRLNNPDLTMTLDNSYPLSPNSAAINDSTGRLDFFIFSDSLGNRGPSFVFKVNGNTVGSIERKCANLLGQFALPVVNNWNTSGDSKVGVDFTPPNVNSWTAKPNQMLYWRHTITASGGTTPGLGFAIGKSGFNGANVWGDGSAANHNKPVGTTPALGAGSSYGVGWGVNRPEYSTYRVLASDGGRTLCQGISWGPTAWNNSAWTASAPACVTVPFNYDLTPSVTGPSGVGVVGGPIAIVTPKVNNQLTGNSSVTTDSPSVEWELKRVEVAPGGTIPLTQQENGTAPCSHYGNACTAKGGGTQSFPAGSTTLAALTGETIAPNTPVGTRICYTLSVRPYSQSSGNWRHSAPVCVKVSKQPKVQVWGGDLRTRGGIETGTTVINSGGSDKLFGSWVEYGGFSVEANDGFASGAGLNNGNTNMSAATWNKLTFANIDNSGSSSFGRYTLDALPTITNQFIGASSGGAFNSDLGALNSGTYNVGSVTINASTVGQSAGVGKSIIIVSSGTVTIAGDITYAGVSGDTFTTPSQIPQVIIIARNINITGGASRVDAWLLTSPAGGAISTCSDRPVNAPLNSTVCNNSLTVNGPVATDHLYLRRTAGSDSVAAAGAPSEVFNLRSDAYLWAYARASQSGKAQTVYSVELPPRF